MARKKSFKIVSASTEYAADLVALYQDFHPQTRESRADLERWLALVVWSRSDWLLLAYDDAQGKSVGFVHATVQVLPGELGKQVTVEELYVNASMQGRGVGKAFFDEIRERCRADKDVKVLQIRAPRGSDQDPTAFY
ncbi:MAG: GNAT family N-acetyltransferase, partial [Candidatus Methylomirabilis sp.]|nr:GNAT family N-acetyltransferase [Deltaproteobacteria bacterium]